MTAVQTAALDVSQQHGPLLAVDGLRVWFPVRRGVLRRRVGWVKAVDDVNFQLSAGKTLGVVGESGAGKTTVARAIVRIQPMTAGAVRLAGIDLGALHGAELRRARRQVQMIFQDPYGSLDPRQTVGDILAEPLAVHSLVPRVGRAARVAELLELVGLEPGHADRYPRELSGGQRQRVGIARAIAVQPALIVCDEPVSSLDVSIQAQVINLLKRLQRELGLSYVFIAHDLAVVRHIADRVAVMYLGRVAESGPVESVYNHPAHPYTVALLSAALPIEATARRRKRIILPGEIPSPDRPPTGCSFHPRCWLRTRLGNPDICEREPPQLRSVAGSEAVACHFAERTSEFDQTAAAAHDSLELGPSPSDGAAA